MSNSQATSQAPSGKREDITLLVRNFNFPLPHALKSPTSVIQAAPITINNSTLSNVDNFNPSSNDTSTTSDIFPSGSMPLDRNSKVKPYVDFSEYFDNFERRKKEETLLNLCSSKMLI